MLWDKLVPGVTYVPAAINSPHFISLEKKSQQTDKQRCVLNRTLIHYSTSLCTINSVSRVLHGHHALDALSFATVLESGRGYQALMHFRVYPKMKINKKTICHSTVVSVSVLLRVYCS